MWIDCWMALEWRELSCLPAIRTKRAQLFSRHFIHSIPQRLDWVGMKCWLAAQRGCLVLRSLFSLLVRFVFSSISSKWKKDSRSSKKKNNSLSLFVDSWDWLVFCFRSLPFGGAIGGATAHNPPKERKTKPISSHSSKSGVAFSVQWKQINSTISLIINEMELIVSFPREAPMLVNFIPFSINLPIRKRRLMEWKKLNERRGVSILN